MLHTPEHCPNPFNLLLDVRIIKDPANRDGWVAQNINTGRYCFIINLSDQIEKLEPGQIWTAQLLVDGPRYSKIKLCYQLSQH